ncbi:hypothetical protein M406DRAFT_349856 [Cryphonectria parasitica EP155]|uniref:Uncharacterized protein n=1 Tax=Cryphonectria parasitica (strain ATCC 38755 / EP155) TaxID=660469 RepID=A0A9P5CSU7_CRYP1|nr:uncharacterized protein M406DRAFT_349856 [Cryphonectria parasitica EP155]KAF3768726.1 hypothetical protein M406DRAFT_349856 [Cryphonectria parasitica EP155]
MGVTRLWFFTLQPTVSATDPAFTSLWTEVLELCATYTPSTPSPSASQFRMSLFNKPAPPKRSHHFLFQAVGGKEIDGHGDDHSDEGNEPVFVLISTYPSLALCSQANAVYARRYQSQMSQYVRHRAVRQMDLEDAEVMAALLASSPKGTTHSLPNNEGNGDVIDDDDDTDDEKRAPSTITLTISSRDPLVTEVKESLSSPDRRARVPPPTEEISGADTYHAPAAPPPPVVDGEAGGTDAFEARKREGRKWIRLSRRAGAGSEYGDVEMFKLRELLSR